MGGLDHIDLENDHPAKVVYEVNLNRLIERALANQPTVTLWQTIQDTPLEHCTPLVYNSWLFAVGGRDNIHRCKPSPAIHVYKHETKVWEKVGEPSTARFLCTCSVLPDGFMPGEIIVAGGEIEEECICDVEFLTIKNTGV